MDIQISQDHHSWRNNYFNFIKRLETAFKEVWPKFEFANFDSVFTNRKDHLTKTKTVYVVVMYGDISGYWLYPDQLAQLSRELDENDNHVIFITDTYFALTDKRTFSINGRMHVIRIPETCGFYYLPDYEVPHPTQYEKLYSAFNQRGQFNRLDLFLKLVHYNLLDKGYVSFHAENRLRAGQVQTIKDRREYANQLYNHLERIGEDLPHEKREYLDLIPYRNFKEPKFMHDVEANAQYSIVVETYDIYDDLIYMSCMTEKTFRTLVTPTTSLIMNTPASFGILKQMQFSLDVDMSHLHKLDEKTDFIIDTLLNPAEPDPEAVYKRAMDNNVILEHYWNYVQPKHYIDTITEQVEEFDIAVGK